jgi:hypothetical protein
MKKGIDAECPALGQRVSVVQTDIERDRRSARSLGSRPAED